jgi:hypothetical protein
MYSVVCDRCGKAFIDEFNGIAAWLDEGTAKECWQEMQKHQPFGWVKSTLFKDLALVQRVTTLYVEINRDIIDYKDTLEKFTFADCTPFGVKVEE